MEWNGQKAREAIESFAFGPEELVAAVEVFRSEMEKGLQGSADSTLKPLPSYLGLPTGDEQGEFITLDFGGTNVRAEHVRLFGGGQYELAARVAKPLIVPGRYNHAGHGSSAEGLFNFLVGNYFVRGGNLAALKSARGFNNYHVARIELVVEGVKVVNLADLLESYSDYLCHDILLNSPHSLVVRRFIFTFCFICKAELSHSSIIFISFILVNLAASFPAS